MLLHPPPPIVLLPWVARLLPLLAVRRSSSSMKQPESTLVLRWVLINLQSTYLKLTRAYTHLSTVTTGLSALHQHLAIRRLHCMCWDMSSMRLCVDLMCRRVSPTLRAVAFFCNLLSWTVHPFGHSFTFITVTTGCLVFCCIFAWIYVYVFSCIFLLYFVGFIFLLFCLGFVGFRLHLVLRLIFVVETLVPCWFFVVPALQLSFYSSGCSTHIELFMEFLCILHRLVRPWNRPNLLIVLFELLVIIIACYSVLLDQSKICSCICIAFYHLGSIVGVPSPFILGLLLEIPPHILFLGSFTFSSIWIRSGKDPSL